MKITAEAAAKILTEQRCVLILSHANPDGDTLGCAFALWNALQAIGIQARVACSDPLPARFSYLYRGYEDAHRSSAAESWEKEFVVAVDIAATQLLGAGLSGYADRIDLCIDHHPSNEGFARDTCLIPTAAAACEIIYSVIAAMGCPVTEQIADCLYTGIATDTGCFKFSNTSVNTHRIAAKLFEHGARYAWINNYLFDTKSKSRIAVEQQVLATMEYFHEGKIAVITVMQDVIGRTGADESELEGLSGIPRMIEGVMVGITIREKPNGLYKISVRTTEDVDASQICAVFSGGGHARAAGCQLEEEYDRVKTLLVETAERFLPPAVC